MTSQIIANCAKIETMLFVILCQYS